MEKFSGGSFLVRTSNPADIFDPSSFNPEHLSIAAAAREFWSHEVEPRLPTIRQKDLQALKETLRKSADLGFAGLSIPERFGGMELDLVSVMLVEECFARDASYLVTHGGHAGIGSLPLVLFGTEEQKSRYLSKLASAEMIAAYALTEPQAGSDAMAIQTRADLNTAGTHYILNGQKMWITNGGIGDLFTVFAKVNREMFTAFLVERSYPGVSIGAEEHKMGLEGSSTTAVYFDNVPVPVENRLGEAGRGHIIAFNVLNVGRLKIGPYAAGAAKEVLSLSIRYAKDRKAFGKPIADFGAIRAKLADIAIHAYVTESMFWRVVGMIQSAGLESDPAAMIQSLEEYAIECSIVKVFASEAAGSAVDEGVQIHGGYGYHRDYAVERFYRDARIFRIFEGTNEINRLLITETLLKRAAAGRLCLDRPSPGESDGLADMVTRSKDAAFATLKLCGTRFGAQLREQQGILTAIANIVIDVFAMESAWLRAEKLSASGRGRHAGDMCAVFASGAVERIAGEARAVFTACGELAPPDIGLAHADVIGLREKIAAKLLENGRYIV